MEILASPFGAPQDDEAGYGSQIKSLVNRLGGDDDNSGQMNSAAVTWAEPIDGDPRVALRGSSG